ncbi:hypothetical protein ACQI5H_09735 [Mycobacterium heidelbergense]|uniref:hypothetical protein n=1 Tax=Mycobacterium heidelbergense TaxID=53376 RepID=UPI003CEF83A2
MATITRRSALAMLGWAGGLAGVGYALRSVVGQCRLDPIWNSVAHADGGGMMGATSMDMSTYMEMFNRHNEIRRIVEEIPGGVRTTTESDSPDLAAQLHAHVPSMYAHLGQGIEIMCMSQSLPILFPRAGDYQRQITLTPKGVVAVETAEDPALAQAIRAHAQEVSGFVRDGMPAMMRGMMGPSMSGPGMMGPGMMGHP